MAISKLDWIEKDLYNSNLEHRMKIIEERRFRVLRVIINPIVEPIFVITVFFDRRRKEKHIET